MPRPIYNEFKAPLCQDCEEICKHRVVVNCNSVCGREDKFCNIDKIIKKSKGLICRFCKERKIVR